TGPPHGLTRTTARWRPAIGLAPLAQASRIRQIQPHKSYKVWPRSLYSAARHNGGNHGTESRRVRSWPDGDQIAAIGAQHAGRGALPSHGGSLRSSGKPFSL